MRYDPSLIEKKWQEFWKEARSFKADEASDKPKYYVLDMFPYPSGSGLHVGHLIGYTATDIVARYKRAKGYSVLHPMGWDSFGLPAEQYAVRTGTHPRETTQKNIENFRRQLSAMGFSYDESREFATSDPDYYRWTQKLFLFLYEKGLAYMADMAVNYCPELGTVLSNEEVENGLSVEGGYPVERRMLRQWILRITAYSDQLLEGLEDLDWPENVKQLQRNWIGKSEGALVRFEVSNKNFLEVFTTRPDTLCGVSFLVIAPEHPEVNQLISENQREAVESYIRIAQSKSERDRISETKVKSGVFTGTYAKHPITGADIPIWISDYVILGYGSGVVMGVPAHDERDREFAETFSLPIYEVLDQDGYCVHSNHRDFHLDGLRDQEAKDYIIAYLQKKNLGEAKVAYKLRDWLFSRQRYWGEPIPIIHFEDGTSRPLEDDELPLLPPEVQDYRPEGFGQGPLAKVKEWVDIHDVKTNRLGRRETHTMPQWAGSCWYYLRFCDAHNFQAPWSHENERYWMPVDLYIGGAEHAVLHLLYSRFWHRVFYEAGMVSNAEPFKKLINQGLVLATSYRIPGKGYVCPEDAREDNGVWTSTSGEELEVRQEKMSKSKLNGVDPQILIDEFGADALRMYAMFSGPLDKNKLWCNQGVSGCRRFLNRFYEMATSSLVQDIDDPKGIALAHRLVHRVSEDIEKMSLNTIPSSFMEFINEFVKLNIYPKAALAMVVQALAPIAPHISEELWTVLGYAPGIDTAGWPKVDLKYLEDTSVTFVIQVNGKLRARLDIDKSTSKENVLSLAKEAVAKYLEDKEIKQEVFVPNRLVNFVL
ncbi:Leucine--tRNA ligase,leucyl-tRNA synthetase,Leucyl-tRNA synthetase,leucine--tRNA ligase,tRNA synthetases class I (I, L, M and V) [Chlamydia poikilotherma]|uniref:Leucine--tRNA ligase n=1 Tax=Chlamydia poikilotherma TaxID=1967783 RepID=A0A3B0PSW5_9CHLA|nr:leucine--tRNA ligase [Chlamydia poikilotherma]SYX09081.1 Leucine--tRNA ligase,leucyl-tRNA synthetase,Leucyl-tRNA synthetase,leucine--tRNA ligase,tRNA synthetases class I (I, L, M and V) [Chlamydia poikilotherma]